MPFLNLQPSVVGPGRHRSILTHIEAVMLFPDDEDRRNQIELDARVHVHREETSAKAVRGRPVQLTEEELVDILSQYADARPINQARAEVERRRFHGILAGGILQHALYDFHRGPRRGLGAIKKDLQKKLCGKESFEKLSNSTLDNEVWAVYRSVSAFWAAHLELSHHNIAAGKPKAFPCDLSELPCFLGIAEAFRRAGEACPHRQYAGTLLMPGRNWMVSPEIDIPQFEVHPKVPANEPPTREPF